jgi:nucleoside transporter
MSDTSDEPAKLAALAAESPLEAPVAPPDGDFHGSATLASWVGVRLSAAMFLHHFSVGAWMVTLSSYVAANSGTSGAGMFAAGFVGVAYGAGPLGGLVSPFLTGILADHFFAAERIMTVLSVLCAVALWTASTATASWVFYLAVLGYFLFYYPSFSLCTSLALHHLRDPVKHYPAVRAFGTLGWVAAGVFVGWAWPAITGDVIEATATPMKIGAVAQLVTAACCLALPHTPPVNHASRRSATTALAPGLWRELFHLPRFRALMLLAVLAHIPSQFYYVYSNVFFNWTGMPAAAAKMTLGQVVEVGCMLLLPVVIMRVSVKAAIVVGLSAWSARFLMLAAASSPTMPGRDALLFTAIALHGVAFTLVTISLQLDVDRCAGRQRRATAQGLFSVAVQGFGCFAGAQLAGAAGARWLPTEVQQATFSGWQLFWLLPACGSAAVLLLAVLVLPRETR